MTYNPWLMSEVAKLKKIYLTSTEAELEREFPRHPVGSTINMAFRLGLKKGKGTRTDTMRKYREIAARHVPTFNFGVVRP